MKDTLPGMIPLTPTLLNDYRKIVMDTFRQTFAQYNTAENMRLYLDKAGDREQLAKDLDPGRSAVFLAQVSGQTVGYLKLNFPPAFTFPVEGAGVEVERIYVDELYQRKGIGDALMDKAISEAARRKAGFIWLGVWENNLKAKTFYLKKGFEVFGSHPFVLGNETQNDLLMRFWLSDLPE